MPGAACPGLIMCGHHWRRELDEVNMVSRLWTVQHSRLGSAADVVRGTTWTAARVIDELLQISVGQDCSCCPVGITAKIASSCGRCYFYTHTASYAVNWFL